MAKSYYLINSNMTKVKRFVKNDKSMHGVFEYLFIDTVKKSRSMRKRTTCNANNSFCRNRFS